MSDMQDEFQQSPVDRMRIGRVPDLSLRISILQVSARADLRHPRVFEFFWLSLALCTMGPSPPNRPMHTVAPTAMLAGSPPAQL